MTWISRTRRKSHSHALLLSASPLSFPSPIFPFFSSYSLFTSFHFNLYFILESNAKDERPLLCARLGF